jgi:hypothetical protein
MSLPNFAAEASLYQSAVRYGALAAYSRNYIRQTQGRGRGIPYVVPQLPPLGAGGSVDCVSAYQSCYVDCSVRYPESGDSAGSLNAQMRQGCFDSCDAALRLCGGAGGGGGFGLGDENL